MMYTTSINSSHLNEKTFVTPEQTKKNHGWITTIVNFAKKFFGMFDRFLSSKKNHEPSIEKLSEEKLLSAIRRFEGGVSSSEKDIQLAKRLLSEVQQNPSLPLSYNRSITMLRLAIQRKENTANGLNTFLV